MINEEFSVWDGHRPWSLKSKQPIFIVLFLLWDNAYWRAHSFSLTTQSKIILTTILDRIKYNSKPWVGGWPSPPPPRPPKSRMNPCRKSRITNHENHVFLIWWWWWWWWWWWEGEGGGGGEREREFTLKASDLTFSSTWHLCTKQTPKVQTSLLINVIHCWNDVVRGCERSY